MKRLSRSGSRALRLAPLFLLLVTTSATAQAPSDSLSRYVPDGKIQAYVEFEGLDAHAEAWKQSAMYKVLNETKTGSMLEELITQAVDKMPAAGRKFSGAEAVTLIKTLAQSGFVFAVTLDPSKPGPDSAQTVLVVRKAFRKETKTLVAKMLAPDAGGKAQLVTVAGHKIVERKGATGPAMNWWVDDVKKEDLIVCSASAAAAVLETIEGAKPNASANATIAALLKAEPSVTGVARVYLTGDILKNPQIPASLGLGGVDKLEMVWGFQGKETVSIAKIAAPKPRKGILALMEQPTFAKTAMLAVPEGVEGFTAMSVDPQKAFEDILALAETAAPNIKTQVDKALDDINKRAKINVRDDVLSQIGPKMVVYSAGTPAPTAGGGFSPIAALTGGAEIPKFTLVAEVPHPTEFARTLDKLVIELNKQIRAAMPAAPTAANPGEEGAGAASKKKGESKPTLEFRPLTTLPSNERGWTMYCPPEFSAFVPKHVRPTIRLSGKVLVLSISPDSAKQAVDLKGGGAAAKDFADALQPVTGNLIGLNVADTRTTLPPILASLPGKLQVLLNQRPPGLPGAGPGGPPPGAPMAGGVPPLGGSGGSRGGLVAGGGPDSAPGGPGAPPTAGGVPPAGFPATGGQLAGQVPGGPAPGAEGGTAAPAGIYFNIDPTKMPKADEIKPLLFPATSSVSVDNEGFRFVSRSAFPDVSMLFGAVGGALGSLGVQGPVPGVGPAAGGPGFQPGGAPAAAAEGDEGRGPGRGRGLAGQRGGLAAPGGPGATPGGAPGEPGAPIGKGRPPQ